MSNVATFNCHLMKASTLALLGAAILLSACDRGQNSEAQKLADERAALERDRAALAQERAAAQQAANEQERARLEAERAALEQEKARLSGNKEAAVAAEHEAKLAAERLKRVEAERKAADEAAARREAELRAQEAQSAVPVATTEPVRGAQSVNYFYDQLDPYGDWVETDQYGYAFRPDAARDPNWRPYTDGGWVYTDYGWTWRSNEEFGWATYHYGRWARVHRLGWIWVPSTEWGPAWVSWRRSDDYVGWAPLPPNAWSKGGYTASVDAHFDIGPGLYNFLRVTDFGEPTYRGRLVEPERNTTIINQTVNVTNVTYQKVQNNFVVVNRGPDIAVINQQARQQVPRLTVIRGSGAPKNATVQGNTIEVITPNLKAPVTVVKPKKVNGTIKVTEVEHGWNGTESENQKFRANARDEAHRADTGVAPVAPVPPAARPPVTTLPATVTTPVARPAKPTPLPPPERMNPVPPTRPVAPVAPVAPTPRATPLPLPLPKDPVVPAAPMPTPVRRPKAPEAQVAPATPAMPVRPDRAEKPEQTKPRPEVMPPAVVKTTPGAVLPGNGAGEISADRPVRVRPPAGGAPTVMPNRSVVKPQPVPQQPVPAKPVKEFQKPPTKSFKVGSPEATPSTAEGAEVKRKP